MSRPDPFLNLLKDFGYPISSWLKVGSWRSRRSAWISSRRSMSCHGRITRLRDRCCLMGA
jgi:hypothetical protein